MNVLNLAKQRNVINKQIEDSTMITISTDKNSDSGKKRSLTLTILISLFIISDFISLRDFFNEKYTFDSMQFNETVFLAFNILDLVFCFYLLKWKKWAFWGMLVSVLLIFILNLYNNVDLFLALLGLSGMALLFGVLQLKENKISG